MEKLIAYCGINCSGCDAYLALQNNDQALREKAAVEWTERYNFKFTPDMMNCSSCQGNGVHVGYCSQCEVRKCASAKGVVNCGACGEFKECKTINGFHAMVPPEMKNQFLENLGLK